MADALFKSNFPSFFYLGTNMLHALQMNNCVHFNPREIHSGGTRFARNWGKLRKIYKNTNMPKNHEYYDLGIIILQPRGPCLLNA